jgi:hypothetical protein
MEEFLNALDDLIAETEGLSVIELVGALELAQNNLIAGRYDEFNNGAVTPQHGLVGPNALLELLADLIADVLGALSVIELVGALELAKNDIIAGLAVAELLTEDGEEATPQHGLISPNALLELLTEDDKEATA